MTIQNLTPTEDQIFLAMWEWLTSFNPNGPAAARVFKGFQNLTPTPVDPTQAGDPELSTYAVLSPGVTQRQDQGVRTYDNANQQVIVSRGTTYSYQFDCYGPRAPDWANKVAIAWNSAPSAEWFLLNSPTPPNPPPSAVALGLMAPLYADEPMQLNIVNGERQFEQRFMTRLYVHVTQSLGLPQDTIIPPVKPDTWPMQVKVPADLLPP